MNIALTPAQRREIIAGTRALCEGKPGNIADNYGDSSQFVVYDAPDGRMTVFVGRYVDQREDGQAVEHMEWWLKLRATGIHRGRQCRKRWQNGVGMCSVDPARAEENTNLALDLLLEQAQRCWADFPEEAVEYPDMDMPE